MKLKLKSDFRDFYDLWFDREGETFERMMRNDITRIQQLDILQNVFGLQVPPHGTAQYAIDDDDESMWVAHIDPLAHCGEGKVVLAGSVIRRSWSGDTTVVKYIGEARGKSTRFLQVGQRAWLLRYESADDWRSNRGSTTVGVIGTAPAHQHCPWPLFAIDFVVDSAGHDYAIDLNTSPGMSGTGMEDVIKPREVVDAIKAYLSAKLLVSGGTP